jgi:hypothetical protein
LQILETAVRNRGAFCPFMTQQCVRPDVARLAAMWVKGDANTCCQGGDRSCCSARVLRMVPQPTVSRAEWYVHLYRRVRLGQSLARFMENSLERGAAGCGQ